MLCELNNPQFEQAKVLAAYLNCDFFTETEVLEQQCFLYSYILKWYQYDGTNYLSLFEATNKKAKPLNVDYINQVIANKKCYKFTYNDALPKAMGLGKLPKQQRVKILDGTAGFTLDAIALLLLNQNYQVTCLENSKILYSLLNDGFLRLTSSPSATHKALAHQLSIHNINFIDYIDNMLTSSVEHSESFDIIYLDPMFEKEKIKTNLAKPKQNMQLLRILCSNPNEPEYLLQCALDYCIKCKKSGVKIVLKRDIKQPKLLPRRVNYSVESKLIRYDVYLG